MTHTPTECEVALLRLRSSTYCSKCDDCKQVAERMQKLADEDAKRCRLALTQLTQRELSILCTDAHHAAAYARGERSAGHPDAGIIDGPTTQAAGMEAAAALEDIAQRLRRLLERAIKPSEKAQEWVKLHIDGDCEAGVLSPEITASDCTLGRLEP